MLHLYRASFRKYTTEKLIVSCFLYAILSTFFIAVFLIKYRIEYVLAFPFIAALFAIYLWLALQRGSAVEHPERLFQSRRLMLVTGLAVLAVTAATLIDFPQLQRLSVPFLIHLPLIAMPFAHVMLYWDEIDLIVFDIGRNTLRPKEASRFYAGGTIWGDHSQL